MTGPGEVAGQNSTVTVDGRRLWAGALAVALVAALLAVVGILIARGVFGVPVLAPEGEGAWGDADTFRYAAYAALAALVAAAVMHLLITFTPRPLQLFGWIVTLMTLVGVFAPFATGGSLASKVATAVINLAIGVAIGSLLAAVARSVVVRGIHRRPEPPPMAPPA